MRISRAYRKFSRKFDRLSADALDMLLGRRQPLVPPRWLNHNGVSFSAADEIVGLVQNYADLRANSAVLDLGCGIGRLAFGLTKVLTLDGKYVGVDIVERAINWMQKEYAGLHPNFTFYHLDVHNSAYNPGGSKKSDEVDFAFLGDQKFDVVVLVSLFTHLYPDHIRHYLKLIRGVLKPGGKLFATVFLNDEFAQSQYQLQKQTGQKLTSRKFRVKGDGFYAAKDGNPEFVAAYDPQQIASMWEDAGMRLEPIRYGSWCNRPGAHHFYQDVTISSPM